MDLKRLKRLTKKKIENKEREFTTPIDDYKEQLSAPWCVSNHLMVTSEPTLIGERKKVDKSRRIVKRTTSPTISIQNSFCNLSGFREQDIEAIKSALTYENEEAHQKEKDTLRQLGIAKRRGLGKKLRYLIAQLEQIRKEMTVCWLDENLSFPTGLLFLVEEVLKERGVAYTLQDNRVAPEPYLKLKWTNKPHEPRYYQKDMISAFCKEHRGVLESAVGTGKTLTLQYIIMALKVNTLIVCPSTDLTVQVYDELKLAFGEKSVEIVTSTRLKKNTPLKPIRIVTISMLASMQKSGTVQKLLKDVDFFAGDEIHHSGSKSYTNLLDDLSHVYYRLGLTGTFLRNDSKLLDMWGFLSKVLYRYTAKQATADGFLTPLKVLIHPLKGKPKRNYQSEYKLNYCGNPDMLEEVGRIITEMAGEDEQILILVGRKDTSGIILHKYLKELGVENTYISGDDKKDVIKKALKDFNSKKIKVLLGTTIVGEGIDIRSTDRLIDCIGGKSEIAVTQAIGRAVRLFLGKKVAYLHTFNMVGTKYLEKHLHIRCDIYRKNFDAEIQVYG